MPEGDPDVVDELKVRVEFEDFLDRFLVLFFECRREGFGLGAGGEREGLGFGEMGGIG